MATCGQGSGRLHNRAHSAPGTQVHRSHLLLMCIRRERLCGALGRRPNWRLDSRRSATRGSACFSSAWLSRAFPSERVSSLHGLALAPRGAVLLPRREVRRVRGRKAWAERAAAFYSSGLDRLAGKPSGGSDGAQYADDAHPYAADLDLFGPGSVFERADRVSDPRRRGHARGMAEVAGYPDEVAARQQAVDRPAPRLDLRESIAVAGANVPAADYTPLAEWGRVSPRTGFAGRGKSPPRPGNAGAIELLGWANCAAWIGWLIVGTTAMPVLGIRPRVARTRGPASCRGRGECSRRWRRPSATSRLLETVLARLEREHFTAARLKELQAAMTAGGLPASAQIGELRPLARMVQLAPQSALPAGRDPADVGHPVRVQAGERGAARSGPAVGRWLRAAGEAEALSSLAGYAFENPERRVPDRRRGAGRGWAPSPSGTRSSRADAVRGQ